MRSTQSFAGRRVVVDGADRLRDGAKVLIPASGDVSDGRPTPPADGETPAKNGSPKKNPAIAAAIPATRSAMKMHEDV